MSNDTMNSDRAFNVGYDAYLDCKSVLDNPFPQLTENFRCWEEGYFTAERNYEIDEQPYCWYMGDNPDQLIYEQPY